MDLTGSYTIPAQRSDVWNALNDPNILRECIPGCETLSMLSETEFAATIVAKIGPLKARFTGRVELSEIDPNNSYRIQGEGSGGVAGFAKGGARVHLQGAGDSTVLTYEIESDRRKARAAGVSSDYRCGKEPVREILHHAGVQNKRGPQRTISLVLGA
jgi:uncharacterized protein